MGDSGRAMTGAGGITATSKGEEMFGSAFDGRVISRFMQFVKPHRMTIIVSLIAVLIFTLTQIAIPLIIREAIDKAIIDVSDGARKLQITVAVFFAVITVNYVSNHYQLNLVAKLAERILTELRRAMFVHLQRVSLSFMDRTEVGRLMSRLQGDVSSIQEFLETSIFAIGDIVLLIGIVTVLLWLDWQLGLLTLSVVPILFVIRIFWLPVAKRAFMRARETSSIVNGALAENINGVRTVQGLTRQMFNFAAFRVKAEENYRAQLRSTQLAQIMVPTVDSLTGGAMAIVIIVGGNMVLRDTLDLGVMVAFLFYVQRFFDPIRSITMQYSIMQRAMASGHRIFEVLDVPVEVEDKPDAIDLPDDIDGSVEFRNVTFGYVKDQPVLKNIKFKIEPGQTIALVGPTGSGKTSTTALLHRFYDVSDGQVLISGHDIRDVTQDSLGRQVAMVQQESFLFTGTVFENIRYHKTDATLDEVVAAAKAVGAHEFIENLPQGYHTLLGQRGGNLSIGQRQLISFARAIVADAKILVLDEATANIDSFTEREIQQALAVTLKGRTGIVIAHRLATVRDADRIFVLQNGEIIEAGNHTELIAAKGLYQRLYTMNFSSFDDLPDEVLADAAAYQAGPTVYVPDASRAVDVVGQLISEERRDKYAADVAADYETIRIEREGREDDKRLHTITEARSRCLKPDWNQIRPHAPETLGVEAFRDYDLADLPARIDWTPFFRSWELAGNYPAILEDEEAGQAARELFDDAREMLAQIVKESWLEARAVIGFFPANSVGDDIEVYTDENRDTVRMTFNFLRQQMMKSEQRANLCLADFVAPKDTGIADYIGAFTVTTGHGVEERAKAYKDAGDDYREIMLKALADRLAEALAEQMHERVRQEFWGYAADEHLDNQEIIKEQYQGIRPAPGYPACPDHSEKTKLFELLDAPRNAGVALTESFAMLPAASVSGFYFAHPFAAYFGIGRLGKDQVEDYAGRKGVDLAHAERWLAPNLNYAPKI